MYVNSSRLDGENEVLSLKPFNKAIEHLRDRSKALQQSYTSAKPYPHVVIDNLFEPELLDRIVAEFPQREPQRDWFVWDSAHELKTTSRGIDKLPIFTQMFCLWLNSRDFIKAVEPIVGIENLVGDPVFYGAGLHEMYREGWLEIHADYTKHSTLPFLTRRINLLIYLNRDWDSSWGGELVLQERKNSGIQVGYPPYFNRTIIFPTTERTFHGVPNPLSCPPECSRKLISIYYWSATPLPRFLKAGTRIQWASEPKYNLKKTLKRTLIPRRLREFVKSKLKS